MSYTVTQAYQRVLEEVDKIGSDYFSLPQVLHAFKKEVLDFVGSRTADAEINQEVTDDIRPLVVATKLNIIPNPDFPNQHMAMVPNDYHTRLKVNVLYTDGLTARKPLLERFGEINTNEVSPFKKADRMYPRIQQYSNYFNIITGLEPSSPIQPDKFVLIYFKFPTVGTAGNPSGIIVDLPDQVCELLFAMTANSLLLNIGDERTTAQFQINQTYRKK